MNTEIVKKLQSDPIYLLNIAVENNVDDIFKNLKNLGIEVQPTKDSVFAELVYLFANNKADTANMALNVPYKENTTPGYFPLIHEAGIIPAHIKSSMKTEYDSADTEQDPITDKQASNSTFNWSNMFTNLPGILGGVGSIIGNTKGNVYSNSNSPQNNTVQKSDNSIIIMVVIVIVVVIVIGLIMFFRKPK